MKDQYLIMARNGKMGSESDWCIVAGEKGIDTMTNSFKNRGYSYVYVTKILDYGNIEEFLNYSSRPIESKINELLVINKKLIIEVENMFEKDKNVIYENLPVQKHCYEVELKHGTKLRYYLENRDDDDLKHSFDVIYGLKDVSKITYLGMTYPE